MTMTTIQCLVDASQVPTTYLSDISLATLYCFVQFFPKEINLCGHYDVRLLKATLRQKPLYILKYFGYNYVMTNLPQLIHEKLYISPFN